jgi:multiple sugar transport system substrate-binding protein
MKKISALLATLILVVGLTGCGSQQAQSKKEVTITIKVPTLEMTCVTDPKIGEAYDFLKIATNDFAAQYKDANVKFNLVKFALTDEDAYVSQCFDTENAVDILYEDFFNMSTYIYTGRVVPLDDIIDNQWKQDVSPNYWQQGRRQKRIYMLPYLARQNTLAFHKKFFREAGLDQYLGSYDTIQSWTVEQWDEILAKLKASLPPHVYALAMYARNDQGDTHTMTWLRSHGSKFFTEDGKININTPEGIAALRWLKDNYDKGYYPPNCENIAIKDCGKLFWNNQLVIKMNNVPNVKIDDKELGLVNFPSKDGKGMVTSFVTGFAVFDNGDKEKIKIAKEFLKFFYHNDQYLDYSAGNMSASNKVREKYKDKLYRNAAFVKNSSRVIDFMGETPNWRGVRNVFYKQIQELFRGQKTPEQVAASLDEECNKVIADTEVKFHQ